MRRFIGAVIAILSLVGLIQAPSGAAAAPRTKTSPPVTSPKDDLDEPIRTFVRCDGGHITFGYTGDRRTDSDWFGLYVGKVNRDNPYQNMANYRDSWGITHWMWQWSSWEKERRSPFQRGRFQTVYWSTDGGSYYPWRMTVPQNFNCS
ncbi:hypothetical protein [Streptomyces paromomycinus]|uniref:Secreted protein n=1 Tax=Streptomyces paromomycinus TaxID=92743 RepID=A0A401VYW9_STREY|nr:hypothetical protein GKJPGBOP_01928 [Streptomyces paromomycinus]